MSEIEIPKTDNRLQQMGIDIEQDGMSVFGFINGSAERVSAFIGLGQEPAAHKFREMLKDTIAKTKRSGEGRRSHSIAFPNSTPKGDTFQLNTTLCPAGMMRPAVNVTCSRICSSAHPAAYSLGIT